MRLFSVLLIFAILFSCNEQAQVAEETNSGLPPRDTTPIPTAPAINPDQKPIDAAWNEYWKGFQNTVVKDGRARMFSLVKFPLHGANLLSEVIYNEKATQDDFRAGYNEIFDDFTKLTVGRTKASDVPFYSLIGNEFKGSVAEELGIEEGTRIYKFRVGVVIQTEADNVMGADYYHFGKFNGVYKLSWITTERPQ